MCRSLGPTRRDPRATAAHVRAEDREGIPHGHEPAAENNPGILGGGAQHPAYDLGHPEGGIGRVSGRNDRDPCLADAAYLPGSAHDPAVEGVRGTRDAVLLPDDGYQESGGQEHYSGDAQAALHHYS